MKKRLQKIVCAALTMALVTGILPGQTHPTDTSTKTMTNTSTVAEAAGRTPVQQHGALHVSGTDLKDSHGRKVQLKGVSTHGIAWFPQYVNKSAFQTLRDNYGINLIRLAMYTNTSEGYGTSSIKKVQEGVRYATELGMYVIIDWHILNDGNPNQHKSQARKFFRRMAKRYKNQNNVLYEICNEPNGNVTWEKDIKPYAKTIIKTIRKYSKKSIIIVGTPTWSQDVDVAADSPLKGDNLMYTLHFYAATHKEWIMDKLKAAHKKGLPVIVTEFSICDSSGNGSLDKASGNKWMRLLNKYNISYAAWSLCNKAESSALISSSCSKTSGWSKKDLSAAGKWYFKKTTS
jgi:endoglucanase